jgi:hypothetical protein
MILVDFEELENRGRRWLQDNLEFAAEREEQLKEDWLNHILPAIEDSEEE